MKITLFKIFLQSKFSLKWPKVNSSECLVFGNGPSANETIEQNLDKLKSITKICVNHFASSEIYEKIKPEFYVLLDPAFSKLEMRACEDTLKNLNYKTNWPMSLYVPYTYSKSPKFVKIMSENRMITVIYFNYVVSKGFDFFLSAVYKYGLGMPQCMNVVVAAIFVAIQSGFKKIYVTGVEHSWHENIRVMDDTNEVVLTDGHFYGKRNLVISQDEESRSKEIKSEIANQFLSYHKVFKGHEKLAIMARKNNIEIINISSHSVIDVYERGKLI